MPIPIYLAMTDAEMAACTTLPPKVAWMSCLFSPYGTGLVGIPQSIPPQSMLILSDRIPIFGHDPDLIREQLQDTMELLNCESLLLDFQQPNVPQTQELIGKITALDCKMCVSECYSGNWDGPILVPPVPLDESAETYFRKWGGREIWLEAESSCMQITITENGSSYCSLPSDSRENYPFFCKELLCHYRQDITNTAKFYLSRTPDDLTALLKIAENFNVTRAIGFYREFATNIDKNSLE